MTTLSVNVNKIATLRNARGTDMPNLKHVVADLISWNVRGITVHPRPDERHIKYQDVYELKELIQKYNNNQNLEVEFNIEGYPNESFMALMTEVRPDQCTLVPDPPDVLTSNAGWDCVSCQKQLIEVCAQLREISIRSSLFIDPMDFGHEQVAALKAINPDRVELYTEKYAKNYESDDRDIFTAAYKKTATEVSALGIGLNAGHDLNLSNLKHLVTEIPELDEVSIGHALICEALYLGFEKTINNYHEILGY